MIRLKIEGNKIVKENGEEFLIKGININSPGILKYEENHDFLNDVKEIKKLGANAVRVPICPAYWQSKENYLSEILNPIVKLTRELNLYCCLDWHAQGNLFTGETRDAGKDLIQDFKKYDANKKLAFNVLNKLSKEYGKEEHIIFDIFSMPINIDKNDWRNVSKNLVEIMRKNTKNILIINGLNWSSDLSWVLKNPLPSKNIIYGITYYPFINSQNEDYVLNVKKKYPIILSECGYTKEGTYFGGNKKDYGGKLKKLIEENNISFFAWAYHPKRVPIILNSWGPNDLTEWGKFLKEELLLN
jgi:hypothetical protein